MRDVPIATFINKMDREGRDPFELLDEIAQRPPARGRRRRAGRSAAGRDVPRLLRPVRRPADPDGAHARASTSRRASRSRASTIPKLDQLLPESAVAKLREDVAMVRELCPKFDHEMYRAGHQTPVFFGSAVNNFGVRELLAGRREARAAAAPAAGARAPDRSRPSRRSRASCSRSRRTWIRSTAIASRSCGSRRATSRAACG